MTPAEDEEFEIAIGSRAAAKDEEVDQQAEEGIEEGKASRVDAPEPPIKPPRPPAPHRRAFTASG